MRAKPFDPRPLVDDAPDYVRDKTTGLVWHRCSGRPLYADTDRSQVVYHANYLRYFEFGRASLMRSSGFPYREVEAQGYVYPIVDMRVRFFRGLYYDEPMHIHTRPVNLERDKIQFDYLISHGENGEVICTGYTLHCALNKKGRPTAVDPHTLEMWGSFPE